MLASLLLIQAGEQAILRSWFSLGNASFSLAFCSNTDKPEMQCHGKCQMTAWEQDWENEEQARPF